MSDLHTHSRQKGSPPDKIRVLQNIFVNVSDVLNEIEKTGRYTPPGIFMKYYGYVYFKIRNKPLNLENLV